MIQQCHCWVMNYNLFGTFPTPADLETLAARERRA